MFPERVEKASAILPHAVYAKRTHLFKFSFIYFIMKNFSLRRFLCKTVRAVYTEYEDFSYSLHIP